MMERNEHLICGLAPMMGYSDYPARVWFWLASAPDLLCAPFFRATPSTRPRDIPAGYLPEADAGKPYPATSVLPQIMTTRAEDFVEVAQVFLRRVPVVDLNCGCSTPMVCGNGGGSRLLETPERFRDVLQRAAEALGPERISVKMRAGVSSPAQFDDLLRAVPSGIDHLTVHGRTREERFSGTARWDLVQQAAAALRIPVWGSGDIVDHASLVERRRVAPATRCFLAGRGALRNPWIFDELRTSLPVAIERSALREALLLFFALQRARRQAPERLLRAAEKKLWPASPCRLLPEAWYEVRRHLEEATRIGASEAAGERDRESLSSLKSLWHYLRSSLPPTCWGPEPLRCHEVSRFLRVVDDALAREEGPIPLTYHPELDPVYAGPRRPRAIGEPLDSAD